MTTHRKDPALDAKHQAIIRQLLALPDNRNCADCREAHPRWASVNLGVFLCIACSGHHRKMGTHISVVRSTTLDSWTPEQVERVSKLGNGRVNSIFELCLDQASFRRPSPADAFALEKFIRDKYERRRWVSKDLGGGGGQQAVAPAPSKRTHASTQSRGLQRPTSYEPSHRTQTSSYENRPRRAENSSYDPPRRADPTSYDPPRRGGALSSSFQRADAVSKIVDMGFTPGEAALALDDANGELQLAIESLLIKQKANGAGQSGVQTISQPQENLLDIFGSATQTSKVGTTGSPQALAADLGGSSDNTAPVLLQENFADFGEFESAAPSTGNGQTQANRSTNVVDLKSKLGSLYLQSAASKPQESQSTVPTGATENKAADIETEWWSMPEPAIPASTQSNSTAAPAKAEPSVDSFFDDLIPGNFGKKK